MDIPKAIKPIMIFVGDEQPYNTINPEQAERLLDIKLEKTLTTKALFERLKQKFAVYVIRKPYGSSSGNEQNPFDARIAQDWAELVGNDHMASLPQAERVVDVIFGIMAKEAGRIADFENELEGRQLKDKDGAKKVDVVYKSLVTIHGSKAGESLVKGGGKSVMHKSKSRKKGKTLKPLV